MQPEPWPDFYEGVRAQTGPKIPLSPKERSRRFRARQKQKNSNNLQQTAQKVQKKRQKFGQKIEFEPAQPRSVELPQQPMTSQSTFTFEVITPLTMNQIFSTSRTDNTPQ
ncbi:hypothetical protein GYMLUDRAFT_73459 [Collybiopsis luxurians FD-317 M1]|uniref:Uncharacterized protein n=1 Tax=Collybiopsis luxurians FD-317 M1 TaxID=944289 RepID=A0A0D0CEP9_9AGAR|nr:hypothetical protein GYMLUDRAFT_73459 [Collybiopsis luxurians FD-317 M1]